MEKSAVLIPDLPKLTHFMNLEERTDLLCMAPMADPLGPDGFEDFRSLNFKEEIPDSLEIEKITLTDLSLIKPGKGSEESKSDATNINLFATRILFKSKTTGNCEKNSVKSRDKVCQNKTSVSQQNCPQPSSRRKKVKNRTVKMVIGFCELCDQQLPSLKSLRLHKMEKHGEQKEVFKCFFCNREFDLLRTFIKHLDSEHRQSDGRFSCKVCTRRYSDYQCFVTHIKTAHIKCKEIELENISKTNNEQIKNSISGPSLFETRNREISIRTTEVEKRKRREKNFICDFCGKQFAFHCLLRDHTNLHTGTRPHSCAECGKCFALKSTLKQHSRTHGAARLHRCADCGTGFYAAGDLRKHSRTHTGVRPFACEVCAERFSRRAHLAAHRLRHTNERPHTCEACPRAFAKRGDLIRHKRVHTGELPYLCQVCGRTFRQSAQCANHIKTHHPEYTTPAR